MSWSRTHEYWAGVREAVEEIERDPDAGLPWNPHLAAVFGDRQALLAALRYRWRLMVRAQDDVLPAELALRHAAMIRVLAAPDGLSAHTRLRAVAGR